MRVTKLWETQSVFKTACERHSLESLLRMCESGCKRGGWLRNETETGVCRVSNTSFSRVLASSLSVESFGSAVA